MENLQSTILKKYMSTEKKMTLKKMSLETGIQMTRCFRILNGSEMKLEEYEIIKKVINEKTHKEKDYLELLELCVLNLSKDSIDEIMTLMQSKYRIYLLKQKLNRKEEIKLA